jgi:hypothetical protein
MRFSSVLQPAAVPAPPRGDALRRADGPAEKAPAAVVPCFASLPEELDARVRLVGEWQLFEA